MDIDKSQLFREAKCLAKDARVSPELIRQIYSPGGIWYSQDWRGKKGQRPGLYDVRKTIFAFGESAHIDKGGPKSRPVKERVTVINRGVK